MKIVHVAIQCSAVGEQPVAAFTEQVDLILRIAQTPKRAGIWYEMSAVPLDPGPEVDL